ncbi:MAG: GNAT family N-acetyltransferase [Desulfobacterales bacterium]|nr:GNAT family N-acetyltransferase [Desulfobacterales bacterium]
MKYPKEIVLKDCTEVLIRPLAEADEPALRRFYSEIPEEDRWYMRLDVMDPAVIRGWVRDQQEVISIIALVAGEIVAHARLHTHKYGCYHHQGRLRIIVAPAYRQKRLGSWMLLDLIHLAMEKGLREIRADLVVGVEQPAIESACKLDFFKKAVLEDFVIDPRGQRHDLLIMTKQLHKDWGDF